MGPGNGGWGGPRYEYEKVQKPKNIKDVPRYLSELFGGFFYRLGYIFVIVWKASPLILFTMVFISILVFPLTNWTRQNEDSHTGKMPLWT